MESLPVSGRRVVHWLRAPKAVWSRLHFLLHHSEGDATIALERVAWMSRECIWRAVWSFQPQPARRHGWCKEPDKFVMKALSAYVPKCLVNKNLIWLVIPTAVVYLPEKHWTFPGHYATKAQFTLTKDVFLFDFEWRLYNCKHYKPASINRRHVNRKYKYWASTAARYTVERRGCMRITVSRATHIHTSSPELTSAT